MKAILASISALTDLSFKQVTGQQDASALIRFAKSDKPFEAYSFYPSETDNGGDAWFNHSGGLYDAPRIGDEAYATFMHETGHTLGLKHSFENAGFGRVPAEHDSLEYTVMSYSSYVGANDWLSGPHDFPQTFMMDDIAALQFMYGADFTTNAENSTYQWDQQTGALTISGGGSKTSFDAPETDTIFMTIWDGGGRDTYDFSDWTTALSIDLRPGQWISEPEAGPQSHTANLNREVPDFMAVGMIANALTYQGDPRSLIENANGGHANDTLVANQATNVLTGGGGDDTFEWATLADLQNGGGVPDRIADFSQRDVIDLRALGLELDDINVSADGHQLSGNLDGIGPADFTITVIGYDLNADAMREWLQLV